MSLYYLVCSIFYEPDPKKLSKLLSNLIIDKDIQNNEDFENLSRGSLLWKSLEKHYKCFKTVSKIYCQKSYFIIQGMAT